MKNSVLVILGIGTLGVGAAIWVYRRSRKPAEAAPKQDNPSLTILEPAEESAVYANSTIKLKWLSSKLDGNLSIFYHIDTMDDPLWVQVPDSPDVLNGSCDFEVPDRPGSKMALYIGVWDWDKGEWKAVASTPTNIYIMQYE